MATNLINYALPIYGATASATSQLDAASGASRVIDGNRTAVGTPGYTSQMGYPHGVTIQFGQKRYIKELDVFFLRDNFNDGSPPNLTETGSTFMISAFTLELYDGATLTKSITVTDNNKIRRQIILDAAAAATALKFTATLGSDAYARINEIEAWGYPPLGLAESPTLPEGALDDEYLAPLTLTGGVEPVTVQLSNHPVGLLVDVENRNYYGRLQEAGDFTITTTATDAAGASLSIQSNLTVAAASVGSILLESFPIKDLQTRINQRTVAELRFFASADFITSRGEVIAKKSDDNWFASVPCQIVRDTQRGGAQVVTPIVALPATVNALFNPERARISCELLVGNVTKKIFENQEIPSADYFGKTSLTLEELKNYNSCKIPVRYDETTLARGEILNLFKSHVNPRASAVAYGDVRLSKSPFDTGAPTAIETSDERVGLSSASFSSLAGAIATLSDAFEHSTLNIVGDFPAGMGTASVLDVPENITVRFVGNGKIVVPSGKIVQIKGKLIAGYRQIVTGAGQLDLRDAKCACIRPEWFYSGVGITSYHLAINEAARQASAAFGQTVEFAPNKTYECGGTLSFYYYGRIKFKGYSQIGGVPTIRYTGTGARAIDCRSTAGITFDSVSFEITNPDFEGLFIDLNHFLPNNGSDTIWFTAIDCQFNGKIYSGEVDEIQNATKCHAFICCSKAIITTIERCRFHGAERGVKGVEIPDYYSNVTLINNCTFNACRRSISSPGQYNWNITNNTFEPYKGGIAVALDYEFPGYISYGLTFVGNYVDDLFYQAVTPVRLSGVNGAHIAGNTFEWHESPNSTENIYIENCYGISLTGNSGRGQKHAVRFAGGNHAFTASGNYWVSRDGFKNYTGLETISEYDISDFEFSDQNLGQVSYKRKGLFESIGFHKFAGPNTGGINTEIVVVGRGGGETGASTEDNALRVQNGITSFQIGAVGIDNHFGETEAGDIALSMGNVGKTLRFLFGGIAKFGISAVRIFTPLDFEITSATKGFIQTAPNGSRWRITIDNNGDRVKTQL